MKKNAIAGLALLGAGLAAGGAGGGWWVANMRAEMRESDRQAAPPTSAGKKILYYHDPMYPQQKFDKPGKSPFMDMQLVPVYADESGGGAGVKINPETTQNLGVRTVEVKAASLSRSVDATGSVAFDESALVVVQARTTGWIEKLHARTPNDPIAAGAPLASIYAPEWLAAQEEYLALRPSANRELAAAARARLALLGIPEGQIAALERDGRAEPRVTLNAPRAGYLLPLGPEMAGVGSFAREGMQVAPGMTLFRIVSLASVWVLADVPEAQSASLRAGQAVEVRAQAWPERAFKGVVAALLPEVNPATRTLRARIRVANPGAWLKPGMFAAVRLRGDTVRDALVVPAEAVIATGKRKLVMVATEGGRFAQREVATGMEARHAGVEVVEITRGLRAGERVVVSGQFLLDSEASLKATPAAAPAAVTQAAQSAALAAQPGAAAAPSGDATEHRGSAVIEAIAADSVTLSHGPIDSIKWPAMTMGFRLPAAGLPRGVKVGDRVDFSFTPAGEGEYRITRITPLAPKAGLKK